MTPTTIGPMIILSSNSIMGYFISFRRRCRSAIQYDTTKEAYSISRIGVLFMFGKEMRKIANANVKITYIVICKNLDEAIDEKIKSSPIRLTMKLLIGNMIKGIISRFLKT